jgi:hypothetical protein
MALSGALQSLEKSQKISIMSRGGNRPGAGRPAESQNADTAAMGFVATKVRNAT